MIRAGEIQTIAAKLGVRDTPMYGETSVNTGENLKKLRGEVN